MEREPLADFVKRAQKLMKKQAKQSTIDEIQSRRACHDKWKKENEELFRMSQKKYFKSEKGKCARKKITDKRKSIIKECLSKLDWYEKSLIKEFYKNCPDGYEVDHIVPLCKGGKHVLINLQYLTRQDHIKKGTKIQYRIKFK